MSFDDLNSEIEDYLAEVQELGRSIDRIASTEEAARAVQTVTIGAGLALVARAILMLVTKDETKA